MKNEEKAKQRCSLYMAIEPIDQAISFILRQEPQEDLADDVEALHVLRGLEVVKTILAEELKTSK